MNPVVRLQPLPEQRLGPGGDWPTWGLEDDIRPALAAAVAEGREVVLATLTRLEGRGPRPCGAQMLIRPREDWDGYVSGGCVEAAIAAETAGLRPCDPPRRLVFGRGSPFVDIRLPCGARLEVMAEGLAPDDPASRRLLRAWRDRRPAVWLADAAGRRACLTEGEGPPQAWMRAAARTAREGAPDGGGLVEDAHGGVWWRRYRPAPRLLVVGADPVAIALTQAGAGLGWEVVLNRPKGPPRPPIGFQGLYLRQDPGVALDGLGLDPWTAVVATTHDLEQDTAATAPALAAGCFYVGALGSRSRLQSRRTRLAEAGVPAPALARLKAPVGLDLGAAGPREVALAIMAEALAAWRTPCA